MGPNDDYILLSAYLDGELNSTEGAALEQRLQRDPALRAELEELRQVVALVRQMPMMKAPRNFTLDPEFSMATRPMRVLPPQPIPLRPSNSSFPSRQKARSFAWGGLVAAAATVVVLLFVTLIAFGLLRQKEDERPSEVSDVVVDANANSTATLAEIAAISSNLPPNENTDTFESSPSVNQQGQADEAELIPYASDVAIVPPPIDPLNPIPPVVSPTQILVVPPDTGVGGMGGGGGGTADDGFSTPNPALPPSPSQDAGANADITTQSSVVTEVAADAVPAAQGNAAESAEELPQNFALERAAPSALQIQQTLERLLNLLRLFLIGRNAS